ncbi:unnamed protein product [Peniophora sp. CBMAI 1063]|nr:unnamed protein product [Peniophora sp. CBMAI 1063]
MDPMYYQDLMDYEPNSTQGRLTPDDAMQVDQGNSVTDVQGVEAPSRLLSLPLELVQEIMAEVDPMSLIRLGRVCKDLRGVLAASYPWRNMISRLMNRPYSELPFSPEDARGILMLATLEHKMKCTVTTCNRDGDFVHLLGRRRLCHEHYFTETCGSVQQLRGHMLDIMGRRKEGGRGVYPAKVTGDLMNVIKRVLPLFKGAGTHQARWSLVIVQGLWNDVVLAWEGLQRRDGHGLRERLSNLHLVCGDDCADREAHVCFHRLFDEYEAKGKEAAEKAEFVYDLSLAANPKADSSIFKARQEAGKRARRAALQQRLEGLGYLTMDVTPVLDAYLARCRRFGQLTNNEFRSRLPELRTLLDSRKQERISQYRDERRKIAAQAIMDFNTTNYRDLEKAVAATCSYLRSTSYGVWCHRVTELIDADSVDTPEDRMELRNRMRDLLYNDSHVRQCILDCTIAFCYQQEQMAFPVDFRPPSSSCTLRPSAIEPLIGSSTFMIDVSGFVLEPSSTSFSMF